MTYVYIDESGDLGMNDSKSEYFIITATKVNDDETNKLLKRIPKQIRQRSLKKKLLRTAELKFTNSSVLIREQFLKRAARLNIEVYALVVKKKLTHEKLKNNLPVLYNYLIKILLEKALKELNKTQLTICLDRSMSLNQIENFENYIKTEFLMLFSFIPDVKILHEMSQNRQELQVADFICGAFGYKYNTAKLKGDCAYYTSMISDRIRIEKSDLFKEK